MARQIAKTFQKSKPKVEQTLTVKRSSCVSGRSIESHKFSPQQVALKKQKSSKGSQINDSPPKSSDKGH